MRIAINGFGRIGRVFFRQAWSEFDIVAINDRAPVEQLAYLLEHDSVYGRFHKPISATTGQLIVDGKSIKVLSEAKPGNLPWKALGVEVVIEATGAFTTTARARDHIMAGAKRVILTAPAKDKVTHTATPNLNFATISQQQITSNASCTTNAVNPLIAILKETVGIEKAILTTIHAYTATQRLVDGVTEGEDHLRGRAAALNIVPSTTGAAEATEQVIPEIKGKFDGISIRVPVPSGSLADITVVTKRPTSVEEINKIFIQAAAKSEWQGIIKISQTPLVSSDIIGEPYGAIIDLSLTRVVDGNLIKVCAWYDNEWGYAAMLIKHLQSLAHV